VSEGVDYFYRGHVLAQIQARVALRTRRKMFDLWLRVARSQNLPINSVLDIGATPDTERIDSNCMLNWFHESGAKVTCYSPEDVSNIRRLFSFVSVIPPTPNSRQLPAADQSFDWATSSAVLEHVGTKDSQIDFIRESGRVAKAIFLTTPYRYHWLEFHTKLPFIHWLPRLIHRSILKWLGLNFWSQESNLRLVSRSELRQIARRALGDHHEIQIRFVWALGMPSNLILIAFKKK
jgi:hypothetical protein